jgi:hypothetical protein
LLAAPWIASLALAMTVFGSRWMAGLVLEKCGHDDFMSASFQLRPDRAEAGIC